MISKQVKRPSFTRFASKNTVLCYYFYSGLRNGSGGVTETNYRSTDIVNYKKTDTVGQNTALRQFSKTNKTTKPDNRNQYQNKKAKLFGKRSRVKLKNQLFRDLPVKKLFFATLFLLRA